MTKDKSVKDEEIREDDDEIGCEHYIMHRCSRSLVEYSARGTFYQSVTTRTLQLDRTFDQGWLFSFFGVSHSFFKPFPLVAHWLKVLYTQLNFSRFPLPFPKIYLFKTFPKFPKIFYINM